MGYWKTKVLPQIKKVFGVDVAKKAAAVEACKSFDDSKEELSKEFEEKKAELQPKVLEIYEASSAEIKTLVKDPKEAGLKKHSGDVQSFLDKLNKIEFPGSKVALEACSKFGPALAPETSEVEKEIATVSEEKPCEVAATVAADATTAETAAPPKVEQPQAEEPPKKA
uniref:Plasma membrane-associated cation-binding protein 1 n=1 Tax=Chenopodium quinoa TaxID=63459 RepID=A0A803N8E0_CHEQI